MIKLVILFRRPRGLPEQLMTAVRERLLPSCRSIPGLVREELAVPRELSVSIGRPLGRRDRRGPPFLTLELYFADSATFEAAMDSAEAQAALSQLDEISGHYITVFEAEIESAPAAD